MKKFIDNVILPHKIRFTILTVLFLVVISYGIWLYHENNIINVTEYDISDENIPKSFDGFKIAQVSDFHNTTLGNDNDILIDDIIKEKPDIIVITGDFIDYYHTKRDISERLAECLVKIAPVYYVTGNHEFRMPDELEKLTKDFKNIGVTILKNSEYIIQCGNEKIRICGIDDPNFTGTDRDIGEYGREALKEINSLKTDDTYTVLLSHRPEMFDIYCQSGVNLVFSGHAHGGQFRLPIIGAFYAPGQGLFPKYTEGVHQSGNTTMIVSRGLGQSSIPFRINNSPELVIANLHCD